MHWLEKTPKEIFNNIPDLVLIDLVDRKMKRVISQQEYYLLLNNLMANHILNKHIAPPFIENKENLNRWLLCLYIIE